MRKLLIVLLISILLVLGVCACGKEDTSASSSDVVSVQEIPEMVSTLQHKIDKALESTPTYDDLKEIQSLYDDLLKAEQEMIVNYNQIEEMFTLSKEEVAAIYAVNKLKERLKNPNSIDLISLGLTQDVLEAYHICIQYSAENNFGGRVEENYYVSVDMPIYDEVNKGWSCKLEDVFASSQALDSINALLGDKGDSKAQKNAKRDYESNIEEVIELETEKIIDNIDYPIVEIGENK